MGSGTDLNTWAEKGTPLHPEKVYPNAGLDQAEAVEDGTALIGQANIDKTAHIGSRRLTPQQIGEAWNRISTRVAELFATGVPNNDPRTQQTIHEHYLWICNFWIPDRDSYLRLANLYVNQAKFRKRIERKKPRGMAAYMRDAMTTYAWARLR